MLKLSDRSGRLPGRSVAVTCAPSFPSTSPAEAHATLLA